jgi:hypothetical protein
MRMTFSRYLVSLLVLTLGVLIPPVVHGETSSPLTSEEGYPLEMSDLGTSPWDLDLVSVTGASPAVVLQHQRTASPLSAGLLMLGQGMPFAVRTCYQRVSLRPARSFLPLRC